MSLPENTPPSDESGAFGPGHPEWCPKAPAHLLDPDEHDSHCLHWWDHEPCCWCADNTCSDPYCEFEGCPNRKESLS